jgi:hypothetical protein
VLNNNKNSIFSENKNIVGYDEFLNKFGYFLKDLMDELSPMSHNRWNKDHGEFIFKMIVSKEDRLLKLEVTNTKERLSPSIFLSNFIADLNQSIINQADLRFRKAFRKLANGKMRVGDLVANHILNYNSTYGNGKYQYVKCVDFKKDYFIKNSEEVINKMQEVRKYWIIYQYTYKYVGVQIES